MLAAQGAVVRPRWTSASFLVYAGGVRFRPLQGFHLAVLLIVLLVLLASLLALRVFRFPLLVVLVAAAAWYFATDLLSSGGNWSAVVSLLVGLAFFGVARQVDAGPARPYAFWLHVAAGVAVGGALLTFWDRSDANFALVAVAALAYVAVGAALKRSSYVVLGAYGLYLAAIHFASEWSGGSETAAFLPYLPFFFLFPITQGFYYESLTGNEWAAPLTYAFLGFLLVGLGLVLERRRAPA